MMGTYNAIPVYEETSMVASKPPHEGAASQLRALLQNAKRIVFFGGAGVSTESGIPDFRSESGLFQAKKIYGLPPERLVSHSLFWSNTELFFDYYKHNLIFPDAEPNAAHLALAQLEAEGKLAAVITQNIDGLHQAAGSKAVHELHGSVHRNTCTDCGAHYDLAYILDDANCLGQDGQISAIPYCATCGGIIKPDVVLYEEPLDEQTVQLAIRAIQGADTLIVGGTSLVVYPAAGYLNYFNGNHLILINKSVTGYDNQADLVIHEPIGEVLSEFLLQ
jgi:NAD-dependent deacetylase